MEDGRVPSLFELAAQVIQSRHLRILPQRILERCQMVWSYGRPGGMHTIAAFSVIHRLNNVAVRKSQSSKNEPVWSWHESRTGRTVHLFPRKPWKLERVGYGITFLYNRGEINIISERKEAERIPVSYLRKVGFW